MTHTLAFTAATWTGLVDLLSSEAETAGVLLAGVARDQTGVTLLVREVRWIPDAEYSRRESWGLTISSSGYVPTLKEAAADRTVPIFFHTHPNGRPFPSVADEKVDEQLRGLFQRRSGQDYYASFILGGTTLEPAFSGRIYARSEGSRHEPLSRVRVIGRRWRVLTAADTEEPTVDAGAYDRQVRAFGVAGQRQLARLHVGVVGAGGTGSAVCEMLIRLGVGSITVVDHDVVTQSNLSRIHQAEALDVGRSKVQLVADEATRIGSATRVEAVCGNVAWEATARRLKHCDLIFGCTDDNAGRAVLSRLAYWYLAPVIDTGFLIASRQGRIQGLFGRVTTVMPGEACLICRGRVDPAMVRNDLLHSNERVRLAAEGYAPELGERDPSVVAFTTMSATFAVNELLDRLIGYGAEDVPSELLIRLHDRKLSSNRTAGRPGHYCTETMNWGRGDETPMLSQMWP